MEQAGGRVARTLLAAVLGRFHPRLLRAGRSARNRVDAARGQHASSTSCGSGQHAMLNAERGEVGGGGESVEGALHVDVKLHLRGGTRARQGRVGGRMGGEEGDGGRRSQRKRRGGEWGAGGGTGSRRERCTARAVRVGSHRGDAPAREVCMWRDWAKFGRGVSSPKHGLQMMAHEGGRARGAGGGCCKGQGECGGRVGAPRRSPPCRPAP